MSGEGRGAWVITLLQGFGVGEILWGLLVQVGNHFLSGGRNGDSTLENDGFCLDLLAINALIGVVVRANRRAFQREASKEASGAGVAQYFGPQGDIGRCIRSASLRTCRCRRIRAQLDLVT